MGPRPHRRRISSRWRRSPMSGCSAARSTGPPIARSKSAPCPAWIAQRCRMRLRAPCRRGRRIVSARAPRSATRCRQRSSPNYPCWRPRLLTITISSPRVRSLSRPTWLRATCRSGLRSGTSSPTNRCRSGIPQPGARIPDPGSRILRSRRGIQPPLLHQWNRARRRSLVGWRSFLPRLLVRCSDLRRAIWPSPGHSNSRLHKPWPRLLPEPISRFPRRWRHRRPFVSRSRRSRRPRPRKRHQPSRPRRPGRQRVRGRARPRKLKGLWRDRERWPLNHARWVHRSGSMAGPEARRRCCSPISNRESIES